MNRKLYFNLNPKIKCFLHHAYLFGMIKNDKTCNYLAINNYLQIYINDQNWFDFYTPDFYHQSDLFIKKYFTIPISEFNETNQSIIDVIIKMIDKGYYVSGIFNEFYIPFSWFHNKWDFDHKFLLNGFDEENKTFNMIGYYDGILCEKEISFIDFLFACKNTQKENCELIFIKVNYSVSKNIDIYKIKKNLSEFINSKTTTNYGYKINCIGLMALQNKAESILQKQEVKIPVLYLCYEHAKILKTLLKHILTSNESKRYNLFIRCDDIIHKCEMSINLCLKMQITGKNYIKNIFDNIEYIIVEEEKLIKNILDL